MGGAQMMLYEHLRISKNFGVNNYVISLLGEDVIGDKIKKLGIPVVLLKTPLNKSLLSPWNFVYELTLLINKLKPHLIHSSMTHANLICGVSKVIGVITPIIWSIHNSELTLKHNALSTLGASKLCSILSYSVPQKIIYCSEHARSVHENYGYNNRKSDIIENGIDLIKFSANPQSHISIRKELGLKKDTFLIGSIGRYHKIKNYPVFIVAAGLFHKIKPKTHFILCGNGLTWDNKNIVKLIKKNHLESVIHLIGERNDVEKVIASLDIAVNTSIDESFSLTMAEAMACEVPSVSSNIQGLKNLMGSACYYAQVDNAQDFTYKWINIYNMTLNEKKKVGANARKRIKNKYSVEIMTKKYLKIYHNIVSDEI